MSRAQSPSREQTLTLNLLADKIIQITEAVHLMRNQMQELQISKNANQTEQVFMDRLRGETSENFNSENFDTTIKTYDKAMHLIPEFDGLNVEAFIGHIQIAVKRLAIDQHELLLCSIIAQKLTGRAKGTIRIDATTNFPQLFEKLRFLYGKAQNISALEVQRDTCIQRYNETVDEFINRFLRIHDEIITTINSQNTGVTTICIQEELCQRKSIEIFRRNVKTEIGDHLYSFELDTLNQAFSKARAFEGELQLRKLRMQRNENASRNYNTPRKPPHQKPQFSTKECGYCKRRGHEEKDCRTKTFHLQRGQQNFHGRPTLNRPPDQASHHSHAVEQDPEHRSEELTRDPEEPSPEHPELR